MEGSNPLQEQPAENEKEERSTTLTGGAGPEDREAEESPAQPQEVPEIPRGRGDRSLMYFFWPLVVMIIYAPAGLIWLAYRFLEYKTQLLLLTNKRLVLFKGIIKKKQYMIPLDMAAQMTIEQGFLGRKAGYGTLIIGQGKEAIRYNYVRDPEKFRQLCRTEA